MQDLAQESEAKLAQAGATWKEQLEEVKERCAPYCGRTKSISHHLRDPGRMIPL